MVTPGRNSHYRLINTLGTKMNLRTPKMETPTLLPDKGSITIKVLKITGWVMVSVAWLWALLALFYHAIWPSWIQSISAFLWIVLTAVILRKFSPAKRAWGLLSGVALVWLMWNLNEPSNEREWILNQECMPVAQFQGNKVIIDNVRHTTYRTTEDYDAVWNKRQYDLDAIKTVDFIVEPFSSWRGLAHTFLTFGFENGRYVSISIEIRKEKYESYSPLKGLFRNYELMYVIGDEKDLIGVRANVRKDPVYLFPIKATNRQVRSLFLSMLNHANQLAVKPEFYNSLLNNCTTNILHHVNELRSDKVRFDWRTVFPGYSDELAWELGLIEFNGSLEEARQYFLINKRSTFQVDHRGWSRQIRSIKGIRNVEQ